MNSGRKHSSEKQVAPAANYEEHTLEAEYGFTIRPAPRGGGFLFSWIGIDEQGEEILNPLDSVTETKKWLEDTAQIYGLDFELLKQSKLQAKNTPKPKKQTDSEATNKDAIFEIITEKINHIAPDSGLVENRPYLGFWLLTKVKSEEGTTVKQVFHLLFDDGDLVPYDPATLLSKDITLESQPVYTPLRISIETVMNLAELPEVQPLEVLNDVLTQLKKYIEFDDYRYYPLITYWIMTTYFHKVFSAFPYLYINALKRSGKTKLLEVLKQLSYNAIFSPNMSTSALFRLTQSAGATTLLDETEDLNDPDKKADFKTLLFSGYKKGSPAYRSEKENDAFIPKPYEVYSPKAIANINGLDNVLEDRCIPITMKRGRNLAIINKDIPSNDPEWNRIRDNLSRLFLQIAPEIADAYSKTEKIEDILGIKNDCETSVVSEVNAVSVVSKRVLKNKNLYVARTWELWKPLFATAKYLDNYFSYKDFIYTNYTNYTKYTKTPFEDLLDISVDLINEKVSDDNDTGETTLIIGMLKLVDEDTYYKPKEIIEAAKPYSESEELPAWFNAKWVGRVLKRLGFKDKRRIGKGMEYHLIPEKVRDMADRLNIKLPEGEALPEIKQKKETFYFKLAPKNEHHVCDMNGCDGDGAQEATYEQILNDEQKSVSGKERLFFCQKCYDFGKENAKAENVDCVIVKVCEFCSQPITNPLDIISNDFTNGNPAHTTCYEAKLRSAQK